MRVFHPTDCHIMVKMKTTGSRPYQPHGVPLLQSILGQKLMCEMKQRRFIITSGRWRTAMLPARNNYVIASFLASREYFHQVLSAKELVCVISIANAVAPGFIAATDMNGRSLSNAVDATLAYLIPGPCRRAKRRGWVCLSLASMMLL